MRLAKVAVASVSPTVGAVHSNVVAAHRDRARDGRGRRHASAAFPEQVDRRLPARGSRAVARLSRRPARASSSASPPRPRTRPRSSSSASRVAVGGQLFNAAAIVHRGRILGFVPKEKLPTYNVFYEARTFSHGGAEARARRRTACRSATTSSASTSASSRSRSARTPGRPTARCAAAATPAPRSSSTSRRRRTAWASTTRAARCSRRARPTTRRCCIYANAVGGQDGLIFDGGGLSFRTAGSCSTRRGSAKAGRRRVVDLDRTSRLRMENTTWRTDCEDFRLQQLDVPVIDVRRAHGRSIAARVPRARRAAASSCRRRGRRPSIRATPRSTICSRRSPSASRATSRRPARSARSASRSRAAATRCSRCSSPGARRS